MKIYPMKMKPVYKEMPWGGDKLRTLYDKDIPSEHTGESWEVSAHPNGESVPADGDYAGFPLSSLVTRFPDKLLGKGAPQSAKFPLLFKLIDAKDRLSVQVHPDDALAARVNAKGKTEMWIILDAAPGSGIYAGFKSPCSTEEYRRLIAEGSLESSLNFIHVAAGDAIYIPAGLVHAIGGGLVVAEIQQSSDITYRVFDYNRLGLDGRPRELHVEKAIEATNTTLKGVKSTGRGVPFSGGQRLPLTASQFFTAEQVDLFGKSEEACDGGFRIVFFSSGEGTISAGGADRPFARGDSFLIPAAAERFTVEGRGRYYLFSV